MCLCKGPINRQTVRAAVSKLHLGPYGKDDPGDRAHLSSEVKTTSFWPQGLKESGPHRQPTKEACPRDNILSWTYSPAPLGTFAYVLSFDLSKKSVNEVGQVLILPLRTGAAVESEPDPIPWGSFWSRERCSGREYLSTPREVTRGDATPCNAPLCSFPWGRQSSSAQQL